MVSFYRFYVFCFFVFYASRLFCSVDSVPNSTIFDTHDFQSNPNPDATFQNVNSAPSFPACATHLEALPLITYGVDLTTLNLFPAEANGTLTGYPTFDPTYRAPLFKLTCTNSSNKWNISGESSAKQFPDQIRKVRNGNDLAVSGITEILDTTRRYKTALQSEASSGFYQMGFMSNTEKLRTAQRWILAEDCTVGWFTPSDIQFIAFLQRPNHLPLTDAFLNDTRHLKGATFALNTPLLELWLNTYGTHYFERISFGTKWWMELVLPDDYVEQIGLPKVNNLIELLNNETYGGQAPTPSSKSKLAHAYAAKMQFIHGQWGTRHNPWMIGGTKPISVSRLVSDPETRKQIQIAIDVRIFKAALCEAQYSLELISQNVAKSWILMGPFTAELVIEEIKSLLNQTIITKAELKSINHKAEKIIEFAEAVKGNVGVKTTITRP